MAHLSFTTPIGPLALFDADEAIVAVDWGWLPEPEESPLLLEAQRQILAYFDGALRRFDLPLAPAGTVFQRSVWDIMTKIPYGETRSYGSIAAELGSHPRAVGGACGRNPLPLLIPCHRVLTTGGGLGGYSGHDGPRTKAWLLRHEGAAVEHPSEID